VDFFYALIYLVISITIVKNIETVPEAPDRPPTQINHKQDS